MPCDLAPVHDHGHEIVHIHSSRAVDVGRAHWRAAPAFSPIEDHREQIIDVHDAVAIDVGHTRTIVGDAEDCVAKSKRLSRTAGRAWNPPEFNGATSKPRARASPAVLAITTCEPKNSRLGRASWMVPMIWHAATVVSRLRLSTRTSSIHHGEHRGHRDRRPAIKGEYTA
jgi:hypothetical protein